MPLSQPVKELPLKILPLEVRLGPPQTRKHLQGVMLCPSSQGPIFSTASPTFSSSVASSVEFFIPGNKQPCGHLGALDHGPGTYFLQDIFQGAPLLGRLPLRNKERCPSTPAQAEAAGPHITLPGLPIDLGSVISAPLPCITENAHLKPA